LGIVLELQAITEAVDGAAQRELRAGVVEQLLRAQQAGKRCYLLAGPLVAPDGHTVDGLLAQVEHSQRQIQESGARLDGGIIADAVAEDAAVEGALRAALEDLCLRAQVEADKLQLLCAGPDCVRAAEGLGVGRILHAAPEAVLPGIA